MSAPATGGFDYTLVVPVLLVFIMICMGMELTREDFGRVARAPRPVLVGLFGQLVLLPLGGIAFAAGLGLPSAIALGVLIITACPGGSTSNVFSYLAGANLALSVSLTALSSVLCFMTIPLWIGLGADLLGGGGVLGEEGLRIPFTATAAQLFVVTLLPVVIGMTLRARWPAWSERIREPLRRTTTALMGGALIVIVGGEWETVAAHLRTAAWAALLLVIATLFLGWVVGGAFGLDRQDRFTVSIEIGLQNGALATTIVLSLIDRPDLIVFPGTYAVLSLLPAAAWSLTYRLRTIGP